MPMTSPDHALPGLLPPKILDWGQWLCFDTYLLKIKDREFRGRIKTWSQNKRTKNKLFWSKESKQMLKSSCIMYKGTEISLIKEAYYIEYRNQNLYPVVSKAPPIQISISNNPWRVYLMQDFIKTDIDWQGLNVFSGMRIIQSRLLDKHTQNRHMWYNIAINYEFLLSNWWTP